MSVGIKFDYKLLQFRNTKTGRFMGLGPGIARIKVDGGVVLVFDDDEEPTPRSSSEVRWAKAPRSVLAKCPFKDGDFPD